MAADAELTRLIAEKARVQKSIDQIEDDNTVAGAFGDVNIRRNELSELNAMRDRLNVRIQRRKGQLLGTRDPVWGSVIRVTRDPDDLEGKSSEAMSEVPETPLVPTTPVHVLQVIGGLSADATPEDSELTIAPTTPGVVPFPAFDSRHILLWKPRADGPITSVVFSDDPTKDNQIGAFTKWPSAITHGHLVGDVWVSNQNLTFTDPMDVEVD